MSQPTLLERLNQKEGSGLPLTEKAAISSIQKHLENLLNTRRGHCPLHPHDYGMIDLMSLGSDPARASSRIADEIRSVIDRFEPRLEVINVDPIESERSSRKEPILRFRVKARLARRENQTILFDTDLEPSGFIRRITQVDNE